MGFIPIKEDRSSRASSRLVTKSISKFSGPSPGPRAPSTLTTLVSQSVRLVLSNLILTSSLNGSVDDEELELRMATSR